MQLSHAAAKDHSTVASPTEAYPQASTSTASSPTQSDSPEFFRGRARRVRILQAVEQGDKECLRRFSAEGDGFVDSELRRQVWPLLLGCKNKGKQRAADHEDAMAELASLAGLPEVEDERQVRLDIARSLINYPNDVRDDERDTLRKELETAILTVLRQHPSLHYFQGYHDIVSILLLTLGDTELVASTAGRLSLHRIRDHMGIGLEPTLGYLRLVDRIVAQADPELHRITNLAASTPFFALSWALTLFSHDIESVPVVARLFDFLLAHNPAMICYVIVALLFTKKDHLVATAASCKGDPALMHSALSQLPRIVLARPATHEEQAENVLEIDAEEDLLSSASFLGSSSTLNIDFARSPAFSATSDSELEDSLIGAQELERPSRNAQVPLSASWATDGIDDEEDDLHAYHDSMFSDPDINGPAFDPFPPSANSRPTSCEQAWRRSQTPSPRRHRSRFPDPSPSPTSLDKALPNTVLATDIIASALRLHEAHPLISNEHAIQADEIMGPKSCIFTYALSEEGSLDDDAAEKIVACAEDIVLPEKLPAFALAGSGEDDEAAGDFELVDKPTSSRRRRSSVPLAAHRLNLGPHGWLVVGGVAIAGAAVALGVYNGGAKLPGVGLSRGAGLGTAGVGLGAGGGIPQGSVVVHGAPQAVDFAGRLI